MMTFTDPNKDLVVITTESNWDEPPRMRHYLANQLSQFFNVLYIEIHSKGLPHTRKISDALIVHRLGGYIRGIHRLRLTKALHEMLQTSSIISHVKKYNAPNVILFNFRYDFWRIYCNKLFFLKYFFMNDDFVNLNQADSIAVRKHKQALLNKVVFLSDRVFTSSDPLADDVRDCAKSVSVVYSGHDFDTGFSSGKEKINKREITACVMGFINSNLEINWLAKLAEIENIKINLVGPLEKKEIKERFSQVLNVKFHSPKVGRELQEFLVEQDVLLMPYTSDVINTKATVPAKLLQYLACGKPVVSSFMPNLMALPKGFVYQSSDAACFIRNVVLARDNDSVLLRNARIEYAAGHTWDRRGEELLSLIESDMQSLILGENRK